MYHVNDAQIAHFVTSNVAEIAHFITLDDALNQVLVCQDGIHQTPFYVTLQDFYLLETKPNPASRGQFKGTLPKTVRLSYHPSSVLIIHNLWAS